MRKFSMATLGAALFAALAATTAAAAEPGVWQKHEYSFAYMGFTSTYSCDGLADKLRLLLLAAGARPDAKVRAGACASGFGRPDRLARADLTFYTLAPADQAAAPADGSPTPGHWAPVEFSDHRPRELGTGDCELVEQFKTSVLPLFATRAVDNHTTCVPHQVAGSVINLHFESFSAEKPSAPAKGA